MSPVDRWVSAAASASRQTSRASSFQEDSSSDVPPSAAVVATGGGSGKISSRRLYAELAWREAKAKFVWAVLVLVARICLGAVRQVASLDISDDESFALLTSLDIMGYTVELPTVIPKLLSPVVAILSSLASIVITILPNVLFNPARPGFITAFPPLLQFVKTDFHLPGLPLAPTRVSQYAMGKLTLRQLMVILPVYFVTTLCATAVVRFVVPTGALYGGLDPIPYDDAGGDGNDIMASVSGWAVNFTKEALVNAFAVVGLRVLPELLKLNRIGYVEFWTALVVVWPLCSVSVDSSDVGSTFAPDIVYALRCVRLWDPRIAAAEEELMQSATSRLGKSAHRLGPVVGGLMAGRVMATYFPED